MKPKQITDISYDTPSYRNSPPLNVLKLRRGSEPVAILSSVLDMQSTGGDTLFYYYCYLVSLKCFMRCLQAERYVGDYRPMYSEQCTCSSQLSATNIQITVQLVDAT